MSKINGPVNIVQLQNDNKNITIMFDFHINIQEETICDDHTTLDVHQYLANLFETSKKEYDLFYEESYASDRETFNRRTIYLRSVSRLKKLAKLKRTRFHHFDMRFLFGQLESMPCENCGDKILLFRRAIRYFVKLYNTLFENDKFQKKKFKQDKTLSYRKFKTKQLAYLFHKLLTKWQNKHIQELLVNYINNDIKSEFIQLLDIAQKISKLIPNDYQNLYYDVRADRLDTIYEYVTKSKNFVELYDEFFYQMNLILFPKIIDLFLVRRFLDKSYIKDAIVYCGGYHSCHILFVLIKHFGYNIQFISHKGTNISNKEIIEKIKEFNTFNDAFVFLGELLLPVPIIQCSDISDLRL